MTVPSQLSPGDSKTLQNVMALFDDYVYMEIGSYLGGSLHFHLTNKKCKKAWSIDRRATDKILDERNIDYAYSATTQHMLDIFADNKIPTQKLTTIDGTVLDMPNVPVDLIFVDGEHTNMAVLSDATNCLRFRPKVILFHDDWIVHAGLRSFVKYLELNKAEFDLYKLSCCDISAVVFGDFREPFAEFARDRTFPWTEFEQAAENRLKGLQ